MSFLAYDLVLLGIFVILLGIFLFRKRKDVKREGLLLLYKTKWGVKLIHKIGDRHENGLKILGWVSITLGYLLMAGVIYLVGKVVWIYVLNPQIVRAIKIPPITPLLPYIDKIAPNLNLPPFYFTYWIIIIAVVAIAHEFAHGIFAARSKVPIKSTGFGFFPFFLPIFLAAFVELDEKKMAKKKISHQLAILSAGTFANILTAVLFSLIMIGFFAVAFAPSGIVFDTYPYTQVNTSSIISINNISVANISYNILLNDLNSTGLNRIKTLNGDYAATKDFISQQNSSPDELLLYYNSPAINANLENTIMQINGKTITNVNELANEIHSYSPGTKITLTVLGSDNAPYNKDVVLGADPSNKNLSWLGVGFYNQNGNTLVQAYNQLFSLTKGHVYYASQIGDAGIFIYHLLWWLIIICISVALINMLPMGIFDGGKFFYLTILAITKKEKTAKIAYKIATYFFLFLLLVVMFFWIFYMKF
ncbi:MAG TPA: site-2 protease family protein [Candidatus Omnitrophota bacterium]|nr:site-2 protease family protein [Candidatus Omnitrophota bacterium]